VKIRPDPEGYGRDTLQLLKRGKAMAEEVIASGLKMQGMVMESMEQVRIILAEMQGRIEELERWLGEFL